MGCLDEFLVCLSKMVLLRLVRYVCVVFFLLRIYNSFYRCPWLLLRPLLPQVLLLVYIFVCSYYYYVVLVYKFNGFVTMEWFNLWGS